MVFFFFFGGGEGERGREISDTPAPDSSMTNSLREPVYTVDGFGNGRYLIPISCSGAFLSFYLLAALCAYYRGGGD